MQQIGFATLSVESDEFISMKEKVADTSQLLTVNLGKIQNPNWRRIGANSGMMNSASEVFALKGAYNLSESYFAA